MSSLFSSHYSVQTIGHIKITGVTVDIRRHIPILKGDILYTQKKTEANITVFKVTVDTSDVTYLQESML